MGRCYGPNDQNLWAKITRNVSAFLAIQWRAGAILLGATQQEAFYVKCDAETEPAGSAGDWSGGHRDRCCHRAAGGVA